MASHRSDGSRADRRPALGIRQAGGHEHGPILSVFVTASLSDPLPRDARREPVAAANSNSEFLPSSRPPSMRLLGVKLRVVF